MISYAALVSIITFEIKVIKAIKIAKHFVSVSNLLYLIVTFTFDIAFDFLGSNQPGSLIPLTIKRDLLLYDLFFSIL